MDAPTRNRPLENLFHDAARGLIHLYGSALDAPAALSRYTVDFLTSYLIAAGYFARVEASRLAQVPLDRTIADFLGLGLMNARLWQKAVSGAMAAWRPFWGLQTDKATTALAKGMQAATPAALADCADWNRRLMDFVARGYPEAIARIEPEYGFHFERATHPQIAETERFVLYQIMPSAAAAPVRPKARPVLIIPPYVLGANILGFLPGQNRSYAHNFANQGIPTYIRILKDIATCPPLQVMTAEDDALDTRYFCEIIRHRHDRTLTLNGYCQGGFNALCSLLSGQLDDLVDAFITCVAPMDGTRSPGLSGFLRRLPARFNDLAYGLKTLPNGNRVADGKLMGWVYKLRAIEDENPVAAFFRDLTMAAANPSGRIEVSKTAAALNYWLNFERNDLPLAITRMSFASYTDPIDAEGNLPVKLFGQRLNLKRIQAKNIAWLICYGQGDALVEKEAALAPLDFVPAEVAAFPKGHVAMATSWSDPGSAYALHTRFGPEGHRGPVRFHLDREQRG
jgi:hypothetical protein